MRRNWNIRQSDPALVEELSRTIGVSPILARVIANRGITDVDDARFFLFADLSSCFDPFIMKDMHKAVERINEAISRREKIMLYGDYDVDGITSIALLKTVLGDIGADCITYIPNRLEEGYGLNAEAVKFAGNQGVKLIITADCGIDAVKEVDVAASLGIDVIITDHHEVKEGYVPAATAIVNPMQPDCGYPFKGLAGVGVAYKLACAVTQGRSYDITQHLDLVSLGTVSDIVPQRSENRVFTKKGLELLTESKKTGLKALIKAAGLEKKRISCADIGFVLGPRINAMGRIGSPDVALKLFLTKDPAEAETIAATLNRENSARQKIEAYILDEAMAKIEREINFKHNKIIVLSGERWHAGVIGIVASRIQEKYYRPTILVALDNNIGKGSGRSIERFNLFKALSDSCEHLTEFGGHEAACGLTISRDNFNPFREKINAYASSMLKDEDLMPTVNIDCEIDLRSLSKELIAELDLISPYGPKNTKPIFCTKSVFPQSGPRFIGRNGFKTWVKSGGAGCEIISFRRDSISLPQAGQAVDIAYTPSINNWQGIESIQLELKDLKIQESA